MPKVIGPFFSGWASGSFGGVLTCYWRGDNQPFLINKKKSRSGPQTEQQKENARRFGEHAKMVAIARRNFFKE